MIRLVNTADFKGSVKLPNKSAPLMAGIYEEAIDTYQEEALILLFGYDFYKQMETAFEPEIVEEKWLNLVNGADIDIEGKLYRYDGLKEILTHLIFYSWAVNNFPSINTNSISTPLAENSTTVNNQLYLAMIWNRAVKMICYNPTNVYSYIDEINDYPEYILPHLELESWL